VATNFEGWFGDGSSNSEDRLLLARRCVPDRLRVDEHLSRFEHGRGNPIKQTNGKSVHGDCVVGQLKKALLIFLIMILPAFAKDQNVHDFDPLNFNLD